jgi:dihydrofolate reductase
VHLQLAAVRLGQFCERALVADLGTSDQVCGYHPRVTLLQPVAHPIVDRHRPRAKLGGPRAPSIAAAAVSASVVADNVREQETDMGKIVISENLSLDGVVQDPTGEEGFRHGGWFGQIGETARAEWGKVALDEARSAAALLLGRRSDEYFASRWLPRSGELADRLNSLPKYVVSATLGEPLWSNATVLRGSVLSEVAKLRQQLSGDIVVIASIQLARTLIEHDLVDEFRLKIFPVVLGAGERLFGDTGDKQPVRLVDARPLGDDLTYLTYERVRAA